MKIDVEKFKEDFPRMTTIELILEYNMREEEVSKLGKELGFPPKKKGARTSKYYTFNKQIGRWIVQDGNNYYGSFKTKNEAKRAVDFLKRNNWNKKLLKKFK